MFRYKQLIKVDSVEVPCVQCDEKIIPKRMIGHLKEHHEISSNGKCPWCLTYKWKRGDGSDHYGHRYDCLRAKIDAEKQEQKLVNKQRDVEERMARKRKNVVEVSDGSTLTVHFEHWNCKECTEWLEHPHVNVKKLRDTLPAEYYANVETLPPYQFSISSMLFRNELEFDERVNVDWKWVTLHAETKSKLLWYHVMIRAAAIKSFQNNFLPQIDKSRMQFLPYWCACNGLKDSRPLFQYHKHMICVVAAKYKTTFKRLWNQVRLDEGVSAVGPSYIKCKNLIWLETTQHLISTICYVGDVGSQCNWADEDVAAANVERQGRDDEFLGMKKFKSGQRKRGRHHFYINCPVPPHAPLFFSLTYWNGLDEYMKFHHKNSPPIDQNLVSLQHSRWVTEYTNVSTMRGNVIPILKKGQLNWNGMQIYKDRLDLLSKPLPKSFLIMNKTVVPIEVNNSLRRMTNRQWSKHQMLTGNRFMEYVGDQVYIFGRTQQSILSAVNQVRQELLQTIREQENKIAEKDARIAEKDEEMYKKDKLISTLVTRLLLSEKE
nr:hypothetical protein [Microctonus hyperodae filamentous virus]